MKKQLALLVLIIACSRLSAQSIAVALEDWKTTQGTQNFFYKNVIQTDDDDNVIVAGATLNNGFPDILVAKYNSSGNLLWTRQIAGTAPNGVDFAAGMTVTNTDIYITGAISNNSVTPETDVYTAKLSSATGSVVWSKTYDLAGAHDTGKELFVNGSGDVFVAGSGYNSSMNADFVMLRYNGSTGVQSWANSWGHSSGLDDGATKIRSNGLNITVTGAVTHAANQYKAATLNISQSTGAVLTSTIGAAITTTSVDAVTDMAIDAAGNVIIAGGQYVSGQGYNFYVQKFNGTTLSSVFTYTWNGTASLDDMPKAVATDASNNVLVAGFSNSSTLGRELSLIKLNSSGSFQWLQQSGFSNDDEATDLMIDDNNEVYVTGYRTATTKNYYTAKYDASGTKIWETEMDGSSSLADYATNMALDSSNNVIVTGQSEISPGSYEFVTVKYVPKEVITPTDANNEIPAANFMYYRNSGQLTAADSLLSPVPEVKFYTNNTAPAFYFRETGHSFVFARIDTSAATGDTLHRIDLDFYKSNPGTGTYAMETQENGYLNYFLAHTGLRGIANVKGSRRLITPDLYENIDLMCSSNQNGIKYYFIVKPGGDPNDIKMDFTGASSYSLNGGSNVLSINSSIGSLSFDRPMAYQLTTANATVAVTGWTPDWQINGANNKYKFNTGAYTASLTLVIEVDQGNGLLTASSIQNIKWSTYLGKNSSDMINKVRVDGNNNLYALGQTYSSNFPQGIGANVYQNGISGNMDGFVSRFDSGNQLIWSTYVGGSSNDNLVDIAIHSSGDLYCIGNTNSANLPAKPKSGADNDGTFNGPSLAANAFPEADGFIFQLNQNGLINPWLRYYGGTDRDQLTACVMDLNNTFFIVGQSRSNDITPVSPSGSYTQSNTHTGVSFWDSTLDGIIARFNSSSVITWATYIGSSTTISPINNIPNDALNDITIMDGLDGGPPDIYVTGYSHGSDYPNVSTSGSTNYSSHSTAETDIVISRFTNTGQIVWSTYYGGLAEDVGTCIAYHFGKLYVCGHTASPDFDMVNSGGNYYQLQAGGYDACYLEVNNANVVTHATCIGSSDYEYAVDMALDHSNNTVYISGGSTGSHFPIPSSNPPNTYVQSYGGMWDNFICALRAGNTSLLWATYLGGTDDEVHGSFNDMHQAICVDYNHNLYLGGFTRTSQTQANPFPLDNGGGLPTYFQHQLDGGTDATITKFDITAINAVGIAENALLANEAFVYPNPAANLLFVKLNQGMSQAAYRIVNTIGQVVASGKLQQELSPLNIEKLSSGFYMIEITEADTKISAKFIKHD